MLDDLVTDHSVQVDYFGRGDSLRPNMAVELGLDGTERFDLVASGPRWPHLPATLGHRDSVPRL
jgi:hypothetical protein